MVSEPELILSEEMGLHIMRMWQRIGLRLEVLACYQAEAASSAADAYQATEIAKIAEGCFWQSTGEADSFDLKRSLPSKKEE